MTSPSASPNGITYDRHGFSVGGKRRFLLMGTIAYFRMARSDWRDRLVQLRDCGFNTVDVYVPWNYHETIEGTFDFTTDNRDLAAYLALCQELGLFVYFRPGPYICNEWDGGGLPSWLFTKPDVRLRQNEAPYLFYVHRYLSTVNEIVRPFLYTNGGPIILYALENELDFYPCEDPHGYIASLRDHTLAAGIDVPLTACVGNRTPIPAATGRVDGVLPSPNIYEGRFVEREAALARKVLHDTHYASDAPMSDVPPFVTEMGRDENSLKRILSTGYRGLGPFNFAGGTNFGYTQAVNNWNNLSYLSTSIDFEGMIGFDGRLQPAFYGARRFAGLINAFEEEILTSEPVTSATGGPACDNPLLGTFMVDQQPRPVYCLTGAGDSAFVFLPNVTDEAQSAQVQVGDLRFPQHSQLTVAPGYTHVALANLSLERQGLPVHLRYSTAEVANLTAESDGMRLLLCGERDAEGEICLISDQPIETPVLPDTCRAVTLGNTLTLIFRFGKPGEITLPIGDKRLRLVIADRDTAAREGLSYTPPATSLLDLLAIPRSEGRVPAPALESVWAGSEAKPLETLGVFHGAGWYEFDFTLHEAATAPEIILPHAGDLLTAFVDGKYIGVFKGEGGSLSIPLPASIEPGRHTLRLRAEIWGHSNFHDTRWPAAHLGSLRGVWGTPTLQGEPIEGDWRFAPETPILPVSNTERKAIRGGVCVAGGDSQWASFPLPTLTEASRGAVLTLKGTDCFGAILLGKRVVGRFLFGPSLAIAMTGGPEDRFFLPSEYLATGEPLSLLLHGAGNGGAITTATLELLADAVS